MARDFGLFTIAHGVLALFLLIELGLVAARTHPPSPVSSKPQLTTSVVESWSDYWTNWSLDEHDFLLFASIWSLLVVAYLALTPRFLPRFFHGIAALVLLVITTIFWFAGAIALAVHTPGVGCGAFFGSCGIGYAAVVFAFFIWAIFLALAVFDALTFLRSRGHAAHADTTTRTGAKPYPGV
jgi:hypothetical protein